MLLSHYKSILSQYESQLAKKGSDSTKDGDLLRDLRAMFADGRRLLDLGQQVQAEEELRASRARKECEERSLALEKAAEAFLTADFRREAPPVSFTVDEGPSWSQAEMICTLRVSGNVKDGKGVSVGGSSRPNSRPASRSRTGATSPSMTSVTPRKQRPRSANLSPLRLSLMKEKPRSRPWTPSKARTSSASPSSSDAK